MLNYIKSSIDREKEKRGRAAGGDTFIYKYLHYSSKKITDKNYDFPLIYN